MSYVSINPNLLQHTVSIIDQMHRAELSKLAEVNLNLDSTSPFVQRIIWGEHAHLKALVPDSWLETTRSIEVRYNFVSITDEGVHADDYTGLTIQLEQSTLAPKDINDSHHHRRTVSELDIDIPPQFKAFMDDRAERKIIRARWAKVQRDVKALQVT